MQVSDCVYTRRYYCARTWRKIKCEIQKYGNCFQLNQQQAQNRTAAGCVPSATIWLQSLISLARITNCPASLVRAVINSIFLCPRFGFLIFGYSVFSVVLFCTGSHVLMHYNKRKEKTWHSIFIYGLSILRHIR